MIHYILFIIHTPIHTHTHIIHLPTPMHTYIHTYIHTYRQTDRHTYMHTCILTYRVVPRFCQPSEGESRCCCCNSKTSIPSHNFCQSMSSQSTHYPLTIMTVIRHLPYCLVTFLTKYRNFIKNMINWYTCFYVLLLFIPLWFAK